MGLFNLFRKPLKIEDVVFGVMTAVDKNGFECQSFFMPESRLVGVCLHVIDAAPSVAQKEFYRKIQSKYEQLKEVLIPVLNDELYDWYDGRSIQDFDKELELESISVPVIEDGPVTWSITYVAKQINHWATIELLDFIPISVVIDG